MENLRCDYLFNFKRDHVQLWEMCRYYTKTFDTFSEMAQDKDFLLYRIRCHSKSDVNRIVKLLTNTSEAFNNRDTVKLIRGGAQTRDPQFSNHWMLDVLQTALITWHWNPVVFTLVKPYLHYSQAVTFWPCSADFHTRCFGSTRFNTYGLCCRENAVNIQVKSLPWKHPETKAVSPWGPLSRCSVASSRSAHAVKKN